MAAKVRSGDTVQVISGKDAGKQGRVLRVDPKKNRLFVEGLNIVKRAPAPALAQGHPARRQGGRRDREGGADTHLQRDGHRPGRRQADPRPHRARRRRHASARRDTERHEASGALMAARLKERYEQEIRPELLERFGYSSVMQVPRLEKITLNMGVGEAKQNTAMLEAAIEQLTVIAGQKPAVRRARKSIAELQAAGGHAGRRDGDPARRAHVRDARPAAVDRDSADPRLPRAEPAVVRRARQLLASGSASRSSFPRSTTTRSIRSAG